jgi:hypothetical protein
MADRRAPPPAVRPPDPLRSAALVQAVDAAVERADRDLFALLCRWSNLPGPQPNYGLARSVGERIASHRGRADALVRDLCSLDLERARPGTATEFLPICGVLALAARWQAGVDPRGAMADLQAMAEDVRHLVRESVVLALRQLAHERLEALLDDVAGWMDGYLQASVVLQAIGDRAVLDAARDPAPIVARLDEAFSLAEGAPRSHQRSQGFRTLVHALAEAAVPVLARFPDAGSAWLSSRATTKLPELREAIEAVLAKVRRAGRLDARVEEVARALDGSAPPRRDPTTYVGPTRGRGKKRGR